MNRKEELVEAAHPAHSLWETGRQLWSFATSNTSLAILDQAVVSGSRFVTTIFVGRVCGTEELGVFALTFAIYLLFACSQEALVTTPYTVFGNQLRGPCRQSFAGSVFLKSLAMSLTGAMGLLVAVLAVRAIWGPTGLTRSVPALACGLPFLLAWDFARRYAIAHLKFYQALIIDAATAALQLSLIAWLAWRSDLSAASAYVAWGVGCGCIIIVWWWLIRHEFQFNLSNTRGDWWRSWNLGKWVLGGQIVGLAHGYTGPWILMLVIGEAATGVFSACENIVLLSNPLILAIANLVSATAANAYAEGGREALQGVVRRASLFSASAMAGLWAFLTLAGGYALTSIYGPEFSGNGHVVSAIALATPFWVVSCVMAIGLRTIEWANADFVARLAGLTVMIGGSIIAVHAWGIVGVAYALVVGSATSTAVHMWAFYHHLPTATPSLAAE